MRTNPTRGGDIEKENTHYGATGEPNMRVVLLSDVESRTSYPSSFIVHSKHVFVHESIQMVANK